MEQERKNYHANKLWREAKIKLENYAKSLLGHELLMDFVLPSADISAKISDPLYEYFKAEQVSVLYKDKASDINFLERNSNILSKSSFNRILNKGFTGKTKSQTLDMFAIFCGYESFESFAGVEPISYAN